MITFSTLQGGQVSRIEYNTNSKTALYKIVGMTEQNIEKGTLFEEKSKIKVLLSETIFEKGKRSYNWHLLVNGCDKVSVFIQYEQI